MPKLIMKYFLIRPLIKDLTRRIKGVENKIRLYKSLSIIATILISSIIALMLDMK